MENIDAAQVGKLFVTNVSFAWIESAETYNDQTKKYEKQTGHWTIGATLSDKPSRYGNTQTMTIKVDQGVGQKLAEVLLPVVVADASRKAEQLANDSKAMLQALGERALLCITDMPAK
jgi:hypothetical protein